jgi:hypothetical protein
MQIPPICPFSFHSTPEQVAGVDLLKSLRSPYLAEVYDVHFEKDSLDSTTTGMSHHGMSHHGMRDGMDLLVVRRFYPRGSLRDEIYGVADPLRPYPEKYPKKVKGAGGKGGVHEGGAKHGAGHKGRGLHYKKLKSYGRQILEALSVLRREGVTCFNLQSSNVMLSGTGADTICCLADIENSLLCKAPATALENITVAKEHRVDIDVLHFGHCLFEMAYGHRLNKSEPCERVLSGTYGSPFNNVSKDVADVLKLIFGEGQEEVSKEVPKEVPKEGHEEERAKERAKERATEANQDPESGSKEGAPLVGAPLVGAPRRKSRRIKKITIADVLACDLFKDVPVLVTEKMEMSEAARKIVKVCLASVSNVRGHNLKMFREVHIAQGQ